MAGIAYPLLMFGLGALILLATWAPIVVQRLPLSLPILCVGLGVAFGRLGILQIDLATLIGSHVAERLCEGVILIALMGAGLKLDRPFGWRRWSSTWRLLVVALPLTVGGVMLLGRTALGLPWAECLLLGAALAPTDPVLASDVQTGPPGEGEEGEVRFALTSEAGLNDGVAFPFVMLALALFGARQVSWPWWLGVDLVGKLAAAVAIGWVGGRLMGWMMFRMPRFKLSETGDGLVAAGVTLMAFATAQLVHAYGFVTVFVTAVVIRGSAPKDEFHNAMAQLADQIERILVMLVLVVFGWTVGRGLLAELTWPGAAVGLGLIFVIRPLAAAVGLVGFGAPWEAKALIAFFGIRGVAALYYLLYAFGHADFPDRAAVWSIVGFTILTSVVLHGVTSTPLMQMAGELRGRHRRGTQAGRAPDRPRP